MLTSDQKRQLAKAKEGIPGTPEFKRAKAEAIRRNQIEKCYREYTPPQVIEFQREQKNGR